MHCEFKLNKLFGNHCQEMKRVTLDILQGSWIAVYQHRGAIVTLPDVTAFWKLMYLSTKYSYDPVATTEYHLSFVS